ncbi:MAG: arsenite methyltransferase [Thermodesulfobacteriota bacterium]
MADKSQQEILTAVRDRYSRAAQGGGPSPDISLPTGCCCGGVDPQQISSALGYSAQEIAAAPEGANLGLGCGNPQALAQLQPGETVLDLGCGGGFDCFLAARQVGPQGLVIGVDMTPEMIARARANAAKVEAANVSFRLGEIEHLPVADACVDVIISNCVINLAADKRAVYAEAFRVLRPGGRLAISDVVAFAPLPPEMKQDLSLWASCAAGAELEGDLRAILQETGFSDIAIELNPASAGFIRQWAPGRGLENHLAAARISAVKPRA